MDRKEEMSDLRDEIRTIVEDLIQKCIKLGKLAAGVEAGQPMALDDWFKQGTGQANKS